MSHHLITLMLLLPFIGAVFQAFLPQAEKEGSKSLGRATAIASSLAGSICGLLLVLGMQPQSAELQALEVLPWIGSFSISYRMAVDGLNVLPVLLIAILFPVLIAAEWDQKIGRRGMHGLLLVLQTALAGAVCAQDLFLLFFFWAMSSLPLYFLIGVWGGPQRETAAFRSMVAAAVGNALFFAALVLIYYSIEPHTFSLSELSGGKLSKQTFQILGTDLSVAAVAFGMISLGLALRAPIWPLHGWFVEVAEEAPPSVFVAISAVCVPVATYIFVRLTCSLFPETMASAAEGVVWVGGLNLVIGGICAVSQRRLKVLLAYVCLSEVGLILIGMGSLSAAGMVGAVYQQLALGLGVAGFGLLSGVLMGRTGVGEFRTEAGDPVLGGAATHAPMMALVAGVVVVSLLGFPGSGGFVGHSLLMIGSFSVHPGAVLLGCASLLLATYYLFTLYRFVFLGPEASPRAKAIQDLTLREQAYLYPLVILLVVFGIYPKPLLELVRPTVLALLGSLQ